MMSCRPCFWASDGKALDFFLQLRAGVRDGKYMTIYSSPYSAQEEGLGLNGLLGML